jgi:catechol 2,3-dioxygenase-like lactoylglutathione lyase family enzyme
MRPSKAGLDVNLCVADVDASRRFYVDVLGLEHVETYPAGFGTIHRLRFGDSFLKLTDPTDRPSTGSEGVGIDGAFGIRAVTLQVDDFRATWDAALAAGAPVHMAEAAHPSAGIRVGMVLDPDGNVVEILHRGLPWNDDARGASDDA